MLGKTPEVVLANPINDSRCENYIQELDKPSEENAKV
jgi:hypothetical protein